MADTASFGVYPKQRASPRNETTAARLRGFISGLTGSETGGSVFDPQRGEEQSAKGAGEVASVAGDVPLPPLAALKASLLIPILRGVKGNAFAYKQVMLEHAVQLAERLKAKGASVDDIWHDAKVVENPRLGNDLKGPFEEKWLHEVSRRPGQSLFAPEHQMSRTEKEAFIKENYPSIHSGVDADSAAAIANILKGSIPRSGVYKGLPTKPGEVGTSELLVHPALEQYPHLKNVDFQMMNETLAKDTNVAKLPGGGYYPDIPAIQINKGSALFNPMSKWDPTSVATHELTHRVQHDMGMPQGGSPASMNLGWEEETAMSRMAEALRKMPDTQAQKIGVALDANANLHPHKRYENITGEQQARQAQSRDLMTQTERDIYPPISTTSASIEPKVWTVAKSMSDLKEAPEVNARAMIDALRKFRIIP
jgi:hypothetical protein